jgi:hypothetical protein
MAKAHFPISSFPSTTDRLPNLDIQEYIEDDLSSQASSDGLGFRFQDLDLDSASQDEILSRMPSGHLNKFHDLVDSREILKLVPCYVPCNYLITENIGWETMEVKENLNLDTIYPRKGGLDLSFNLIEIFFYYVLVSRIYCGDFDESAWEMFRLHSLVLKREKHAFLNLNQVLDSLHVHPKDKIDYYLEDVKRLLTCSKFMIKSIQDLIKIAQLGNASRRIIKKLEFYSWLVSRQDVEFKSQIKNLVLGLSRKYHGCNAIQEL